jgi:hypothetical protein
MTIEYRGETFEGYNKPKRTPNHPKKENQQQTKPGGHPSKHDTPKT